MELARRPQFLRPTDKGRTLPLRFLCLLHYVPDVCAFFFSGPRFDSGYWQACWEEPVCCPKTGVAGCTTQKAQTLNANFPHLVIQHPHPGDASGHDIGFSRTLVFPCLCTPPGVRLCRNRFCLPQSKKGKLLCVYRNARTDDPCYCDQFTITMKKVRKAHRRVKKSRTLKAK
jgi:hypothetical protein